MKFLKELGFKDIEQILWLDIETVTIEKELTQESIFWDAWEQKLAWDETVETDEDIIQRYKDKGAIYKEFSKIVSISYGRVSNGVLKVKNLVGDEKDILEHLFKDVQSFVSRGVKFLGVFSGKQFDIPFISFRATVNDIEVIESFDIGGLAPWNIKHVIDVQDILKGSSSTSLSLQAVCASFGIPSPKLGEVTGKNLGEMFHKGMLKEIAEYNNRDVLATCNAFCKYIRLPFVEMEVVNANKEIEVKVEGDLFQRLYQTKDFNAEIRSEFLARIKAKKMKKTEIPTIKELLRASYLEKIPLMGAEKKQLEEINKGRELELEEFFKQNKL
jgi:predicted PolB exonuclease-like 3'-5' exonuclease